MGQRLAALIELRDHARHALRSQNEGWPEVHRQATRRALNRVYDRFVAAYGPINKTTFSTTADGNVTRRMPNLVKFRDDPDAMLVMSLEDYDEVTGKAAKAAIMQKTSWAAASPSSVHSAEEGLLVSSIHAAPSICPTSLRSIAAHRARSSTSSAACSTRTPRAAPGRRPMPTSPAMCARNSPWPRGRSAAYARNVEALRTVQPEDVLPGEIDANLGRT